MEIKVQKGENPPLLCWDIYAEWANNKLGIADTQEKPVKKKDKKK
jgi:hypothetical protein